MKKTNNSIRNILIVLLLFIVSISAISYSLAYLTWTNNEPLINVFTKPNVDIEIEEEFDDEIKKNVVVKNTGNVPIYVRVALKPAWIVYDEDDNEVVSGYTADEIVLSNLVDWLKIGDYYYYTKALPPGMVTTELIGNAGIAAPLKPDNSLTYKIDVISTSIQANPTDAVMETWNVEVVNDEIVGER